MPLDCSDTIPAGIHHNSWIVAPKNQFNHAWIDIKPHHLRELYEYLHSDVSIRSMDVIRISCPGCHGEGKQQYVLKPPQAVQGATHHLEDPRDG